MMEEPHPRFLQPLSPDAEELDVRVNGLNGLHQAGSVKVPRSFSSDQQDLLRFHPCSAPLFPFLVEITDLPDDPEGQI